MTFELSAPVVKLKERDVTAQIKDFLEFRGWQLIRLHSGLFRPLRRDHLVPDDNDNRRLRIGEVGMADWVAVHPKRAAIFLEFKTPGARPSHDQRDWLRRKRLQRFEADWFDSLEKFKTWYFERFPK